MPSPGISQGTLNRLRASIVVPDFDSLNVTASFLGDEGIGLSFEGQSTLFLDELTGRVASPEPYLPATVTIHLLKSQFLANIYKTQMEGNSLIGDITVRSDAAVMLPWLIQNCSIQNVDKLTFNGKDAGYRVTIGGTYTVNNDLWNS